MSGLRSWPRTVPTVSQGNKDNAQRTPKWSGTDCGDHDQHAFNIQLFRQFLALTISFPMGCPRNAYENQANCDDIAAHPIALCLE